jgi:outer membrane protein OmpA-like peptidoglycan-associated protein
MKSSKRVRYQAALSLCVLLANACQNGNFGATEVGSLGGAAAGAGLGAIIGHQTGHTGGGIAIGSAAGALTGALVGSQIDRQDRAISDRQRRIDEQDRLIAENRRLLEELRERGIDVRDSNRGIVVNLPDVLFDFGKANLTARAEDTVREIANVVRNTPSRRIFVEGHTDSIGTIEYNYRLSQSRAERVADSLARNGIPHRSISVRAFGETEPITTNNTEQGRRRNRRVEVIIENPRR